MKTVGVYDAKTNLSQLLEEVEQGEIVIITRHGQPVAELRPSTPAAAYSIPDAIAQLRTLRKGNRLDGLPLRAMIEDGRR